MTGEPSPKKRGRPVGGQGRAERKNVSLDPDLVGMLNAKAEGLEKHFGFRPTLSQVVRYLINKSTKEIAE